MLIAQYGLYIQIVLSDNTSIERNLSSFDDIPSIRLEDIKLFKLFSNAKIIMSFQEQDIKMYNSVAVLDNKNKILSGWQLRYYIKRQKPDLFNSRSKSE